MVCRERSVAGVFAALILRAGKIVRIAPNEFSIDDPNVVKIIYGHSTEFPKADWCAFYQEMYLNQHTNYTRAQRLWLDESNAEKRTTIHYPEHILLSYGSATEVCCVVFHVYADGL